MAAAKPFVRKLMLAIAKTTTNGLLMIPILQQLLGTHTGAVSSGLTHSCSDWGFRRLEQVLNLNEAVENRCRLQSVRAHVTRRLVGG